MAFVYKITARAAWDAAHRIGRFEGAAIDLVDGYIHLSTAGQAAETARRHFSGQSDLVLLRIETRRLGASLKWEPARGGELFPHLYGPLDPRLVRGVTDAPLGTDGVPQLGALG